MRGYSIFKLSFVTLYETIKLIMLVILIASLASLLYKAYVIYTLGEKAQKFLQLTNQWRNALLFNIYSFTIPVWKDSIYFFLYKQSLLDLATTFENNCLIIEKNSFKPCISNVNYCETCICLIEFRDANLIMNKIKSLVITFTSPKTYKNINFYLTNYYDIPFSFSLKGVSELSSDFIGIESNTVVENLYGKISLNAKDLIPYLDFSYNILNPYISSYIKKIILQNANDVKKLFCFNLGKTIIILNDNGFPFMFGLYGLDNYYYLGDRIGYITLNTYSLDFNYKILAISRNFVIK